jgi:hypothetical protein
MSPLTTVTLDGRRFEGVVLERGQSSGDKETITFRNGQFHSSACDAYGYGDGRYTTRLGPDGESLEFECDTESAEHGRLHWHGRVHDGRLDGSLTMLRDGQKMGEKWVVAAEVRP